MVEGMVSHGVPYATAAESVDLGIHAATEAMLKLDEISARASTVLIRAQILEIALGLVLADAKRKQSSLRTVLENMGPIVMAAITLERKI